MDKRTRYEKPLCYIAKRNIRLMTIGGSTGTDDAFSREHGLESDECQFWDRKGFELDDYNEFVWQ